MNKHSPFRDSPKLKQAEMGFVQPQEEEPITPIEKQQWIVNEGTNEESKNEKDSSDTAYE